MKNNGFWSKYIPLLLVVSMLVYGLLLFNKNNVNKETDAVKFKNEYSELNNQINDKNNKEYPNVSLNDDNLFTYASEDDIKALFDGGSGVIYFGFPQCPWCRNLVPVLESSAEGTSLDKIYYYNIHDIRSTITVDDNNNLSNTKGSDFYYYLLDKLDSYLEEYKVNNIDTGEKRLYAPTLVFIKYGRVVGFHEGTVDSQTDPFVVLDDNQKDELQGIINENINKVLEICDEKC